MTIELNVKEGNLLSSVKNSLRILRCFSMEEPEKRVIDIAEELGLSKSAVSRILITLASEGFVIKDPKTQMYRLGPSVLTLSGVFTSHLEMTEAVHPVVFDLAEITQETVQFIVLDIPKIFVLLIEECKHPVRIMSHPGRKNPIHCTSSGKVLLAHQDESTIEEYIRNGLERYTSKTITDPDRFRASLKTAKELGYAINDEEFIDGVVGVSAPVYDYSNNVVAAINVVGPIQRITRHRLPQIIKQVISAAGQASRQLGYMGNGRK
jgi:DNA-binding IclR family transcriptional regulator